MVTQIDLRPIAQNRAATKVILLARGQLNRAFRQRGLFPPDPLPDGSLRRVMPIDPANAEMIDPDDPVQCGMDQALATYGAAYLDWSAGLPVKLVSPVLAILGETLAALRSSDPQDPAALAAVEEACDYLLERAPRPR